MSATAIGTTYAPVTPLRPPRPLRPLEAALWNRLRPNELGARFSEARFGHLIARPTGAAAPDTVPSGAAIRAQFQSPPRA
jgi:hypothetical protein